MLNESHPDIDKMHCNNCDSVIQIDFTESTKALSGLLFTLTDSFGGEVFQCPVCGIRDPDNMDAVTVLKDRT